MASADQSPSPDDRRTSALTKHGDAARLKVLIVDDDAPTRGVLRRVLEGDFQVEAYEADDGLGALECLSSEVFALVLIDLNMQVINGVETLQAIRRTPALRTLPVVAISGMFDERQTKQLVELNITDVVAKPVVPSTLRRRLAPLMAKLQDRGKTSGPVVRSKLNLRATDRILLVGPFDRFQDCLNTHLRCVCDVAIFPSAASALRDALEQTPDAVFITGDDFLLPPALFAKKLRPSFEVRPKVFLCEPSAAPFSDDGRWFDGHLNKATNASELFRELRPLLTNSGLAIALLPPRSPLVEALIQSAVSALQQAAGTTLCVTQTRPLWSSADHRAIEAVTRLVVDDLVWRVEMLVTHEQALRYTGSRGGQTSSDVISEIDIVAAINAFSGDLTNGLRGALLQYDVSAVVGATESQPITGHGCFSTIDDDSRVGWITSNQNGALVAAVRVTLATA